MKARRAQAVGVLAVCLLAVACGQSRRPAALPPHTHPELARLFQPQLEPLGLRLTRGSLVDVQTREPSPEGRHLALYVEPTGPSSDTRYVEAIVPLTRVFVPSIFRRWPDLVSFDVCQEPPPGVDDRPEPPALTTVDIQRQLADEIDWPSADLATLLGAAARDPNRLRVVVAGHLQQEPAYQEAAARAQGPPAS